MLIGVNKSQIVFVSSKGIIGSFNYVLSISGFIENKTLCNNYALGLSIQICEKYVENKQRR